MPFTKAGKELADARERLKSNPIDGKDWDKDAWVKAHADATSAQDRIPTPANLIRGLRGRL